jgi:hypothetical protein
MKVRDALAGVLSAVHEITDSFGSPADRSKVKTYLASPKQASFDTYLYVGRIPLANFYAHAEVALDKASLWQEVQDQVGMPQLPPPKKWDSHTPLMDLALWVHAND